MIWPFARRDYNSPDSFERTLSQIADKIKRTSNKLAVLRQRARRYNGLLIFYGILGYLVYLVVLLLFFGYQNITPGQGGGLFGAPLGIYTIKRLVQEYYAYRIRNAEAYLTELQKEQVDTIDRLKKATRYSTTQSLIEKYGASAGLIVNEMPNEPAKPKKGSTPHRPGPQRPHGGRGAPQPMPVPAPQVPQQLEPQQIQQRIVQQQLMSQQQEGYSPVPGSRIPAGPQKPPTPQPLHMQGHVHAPSIHHVQPEEATSPKWYDRIMDVILGEDETSAKNRYALICKKCRMVNGLAPPGTLDPRDVEEWGCARCGTMNGKKREETPPAPPSPVVVPKGERKIASGRNSATPPALTPEEDSTSSGEEGSGVQVLPDEVEDYSEPEELVAPVQKPKPKGKKK